MSNNKKLECITEINNLTCEILTITHDPLTSLKENLSNLYALMTEQEKENNSEICQTTSLQPLTKLIDSFTDFISSIQEKTEEMKDKYISKTQIEDIIRGSQYTLGTDPQTYYHIIDEILNNLKKEKENV